MLQPRHPRVMRPRLTKADMRFAGAGASSHVQGITLPTLRSVYGNRPVRYADGRLYAGDEVVRERKP